MNPSITTTPARKTDWRALILGLYLAVCALGLLGLCAVTFSMAVRAIVTADLSFGLTAFLLAGGLFFSALLLLPGAYLNARKFFNLPDLPLNLPRINEAALLMILVTLWIVTLALGQAVSSTPLAVVVLPILNFLAAGLPIVLFLRIALRKLELPSAQHGWSIFGVTLASAPLVGVLLEGIVFIILIFLIAIYAASDSEITRQLAQLTELFQNTSSDPDAVSAAAAPMLFTPLGILSMLGLFSVAVPAIEEAVKVAALWLFADKIKHPVQGFALGIFCGAAFALAENMGFASTGAENWISTVFLRASSALPHMLNSGILGWALVSAWKKQKHSYLRLGAAYTAVILIHGLWNAVSVGLLLDSMATYVQDVPYFLQDATPFLTGWLVLILGTFAGLGYCNRVLRPRPPVDVGYNEPPP